MEAAIGLSAVAGLPLIGMLPGLFLQGYQAGLHESFPTLSDLYIFGLCFLLMFLPTLLLGALFPLLTALWTRDGNAVGRRVGKAYAANTGGTIWVLSPEGCFCCLLWVCRGACCSPPECTWPWARHSGCCARRGLTGQFAMGLLPPSF